jgi:CheY-like chemotaxis protein/Tfp pilus assembly protein PilN
LLLEDDPSFREVIKEFLTETGYSVREVKSGMEGIQEVLAGDFAVVLCDMQMPALSGDLFYRAVERARPQLCERFIFMTGHRGDTTANDFIKAASAHALLKPFHLDDLLEAIGEMERQRHLAREPSPRRGPTAIRSVQKWVSRSDLQPVTADRNALNPPLAATANRPCAAGNSSACDNHSRLRIWMNAATVLAMVAVAGLLYTGYRQAEERRVAVSNELQRAQVTWEAVSGDLEKARQDGERAEKFTERARRVTNECARLQWSSALQRIAACTPAHVQLQDIRLRQVGNSGDAWSLRIEARCPGTRLDANAFRCDIQQALGTVFNYGVNARIEQMEEVPADAAGGPAVTFTIVAAIASAEMPTADAAMRSTK